MTKQRIDARQALRDIRSGMDDMALMRKYNLSAKGLQSLFRKLGDAGIIKHINARAVVRDLRAGMTDKELMEEYELSPKGLRKLLDEMERVGIVDEISEPDAVPPKIVIHTDEIAKDIRSHMTREALMEKYRLTPRGLRWVSMMLVSSGVMSWEEIVGNICSRYDELVPETVRDTQRYPLDYEAPIHDLHRPNICGAIRDLSRKGLSVRGIKAKVGETSTLIVGGDEFGEYATFALDATCRWVGKEASGDYVSGFEISNMSVGSMGEFQLLVRLVQLSAPS